MSLRLFDDDREVLGIGAWPSNGHLIADVARLGYLDGTVLDATYGRGNFWREWEPGELVTVDIRTRSDVRADFLALPFRAESFDSVVYDPPYRLSGRRLQDDFDDRYGLQEYRNNPEILEFLSAGLLECWRCTKRYLLVKCQDQVSGSRVVWQTDIFTRLVEERSGRKVDRFEFVSASKNARPRPRSQEHARRNHSTLLVFRRQTGRERPDKITVEEQ